jgi:diguanylate cyclase (GGDEF)-like protein
LRRTAHMDDLTGIANRAHFNQFADSAMADTRAAGGGLALLLIDLDNFKSVNDRCGHLAGDDLLRRTAAVLQAPYLADCFPARLGGDEFVLLVPTDRKKADIHALVGRLLNDLVHIVEARDGPIPVSGTIGISWLDEDGLDRSALLHRADVALYEAKRARRGSGKIYGVPGLIDAAAAKARLHAVR